jgi:hypothetical protein
MRLLPSIRLKDFDLLEVYPDDSHNKVPRRNSHQFPVSRPLRENAFKSFDVELVEQGMERLALRSCPA